jgi:hypothetical protein
MVVDDHVREVARRQGVVPLLRLGVDHGDEVVLVEDDARDGNDRELQDAHEGAVLRPADDAAVSDDRLHSGELVEEVRERDARRDGVRVRVVVREDERALVRAGVADQAVELRLRVRDVARVERHPRCTYGGRA